MKKNIIIHSRNTKMKERGFSSILLIVSVFALTVLFASSASFLAMENFELSVDYMGDKKTIYLAESCLELVLGEIQDNNDLIMIDNTLILRQGSCIINVGDKDSIKEINILAINDKYFKEIRVEIMVEDSLSIKRYRLN